MTYFRSDGWVKSVLGQAIAGASIYVCTQPADVAYVPPIPQVQIYSDPAGLSPITQPVISDGFGHYDFYVPYGTYTVVIVTGGNIQQVYPDQTIGFETGSSGDVSSVFGRTGDVVAQSGDYNVSQITGAAPSANPSFTGTVQIVNAVITGTLGDGTGSAGSFGQILSSTGTGTKWITASGSSGTVSPGTEGQVGLYLTAGDTISGFSNAVFYPETYGAVGDGSHDDTTALQDTINAAQSAGGGTVVLGSKTYLISGALNITESSVAIVGQTAGGPSNGGVSGSIIESNSATANIININTGGTQIYGVMLQNFCVSRSITPTTGDGIVLNSVDDAKLYNIWSIDSRYCFSHVNAQFVWYVDCFAEWTSISNGITGYGFNMIGTNTTGFYSTRLKDCVVANKSGSGTYHGMHVSTSGNGVADLFCEGFESASCTYGVYIDGTSSNYNENIHFLRTIHDNFSVSAFYITGLTSHDSYVEINGGYIEGVGSAIGIDIEGSSGIVVNNVNFIAFGGNSGPCVLINGSSSKNNVVQANVMYCGNSSQVMVKLDACSNNTVSNNVIVGNADSFTTGISLVSASYNTISGNTLSGSGTTGISLDSSSGHNGGVNVVNPTSITTPLSDAGSDNFVTIAASSGGSGSTIWPTMAQPISTNFTWDNQGTSTVFDKTSRMVVTIPDSSGLSPATQMHGFYESLPFSAPYTVTFALSVMGASSSGNAVIAYIGLRDNTGKWVGFGAVYAAPNSGAGNVFVVRRDVWASSTSLSSTGTAIGITTPVGGLIWLRLSDDGTNRTFYSSVNGQDWLPIIVEANTADITPTEIGLAWYNVSVGGLPAVFSVFDYGAANSVLPVIGN